MLENIQKTSGGLFILYVLILTGFTHDIIGCKVQNLFTFNPLAKHLVCFFIIYFFINISETRTINPLKKLTLSIILYGLFLLSINVPIKYFLVILLSLFLIKISEDVKEYIIKNPEKKTDINPVHINNIQKILTGFFIFSIIIGFYQYTNEQMLKYKKEFSWYYHFIGKGRYICDSLKQ